MMMMMEYDYYDCNQTTFCKIDCIDQECDNIIINGTKSTLFNIIGCEDNCDNMTIHCPISKPNQSQYECYISSNCSDLSLNETGIDCGHSDIYIITTTSTITTSSSTSSNTSLIDYKL